MSQYRTIFVDAYKALRGTVVQKIDGPYLAEMVENAMNEVGEGYEFKRYIEVNSSKNTYVEGYVLVFERKARA